MISYLKYGDIMVSKQDVLKQVPQHQIEYVSDTDVICHGGCVDVRTGNASGHYNVLINKSKNLSCQSIGIFDNNGLLELQLHDLIGFGLDDLTNSLILHMCDVDDIKIVAVDF